jgi:hypothetical protein
MYYVTYSCNLFSAVIVFLDFFSSESRLKFLAHVAAAVVRLALAVVAAGQRSGNRIVSNQFGPTQYNA